MSALHLSKTAKFLAILLVVFCLGLLPSLDSSAEDHLVLETKNGKTVSTKLEYFRGNIPADDFYNYYKAKPNTGLESPKSSLVIPYRTASGTSLIVIMGGPGSSQGGAGQLTISGLSKGTELLLRDDPPDVDPTDEYFFNPPIANFHWSWEPGFADGVIIKNLEKYPDLTLDFGTLENITEIRIVSGDPKDHKILTLDPSVDIRLQGVGRELMPKPDFSTSRSPQPGLTLILDGSDSIAPEGTITQYEWDLTGDGHFSYATHEPTIRHTFTDSGSHVIGLRVTDNHGNKTVIQKQITVRRSPFKAERELSARKVLPGKTVDSTIEISARTKVSGIGVEEPLPEGWRIIPANNEKVVYKHSTNQWLLPTVFEPGDKKQITYQIKAPSRSKLDADSIDRKIELSGEISSASPEFGEKIGGDSTLIVVEKVDPLVALSHYEVDKGELNFDLSDRITARQVKRLITAWQKGDDLPGIDRKEINFGFVKKALLYHQKGLGTNSKLSLAQRGNPAVSREIRTNLPNNLLFLDPEGTPSVEEVVEFGVEVKIKPRNRTLMGAGLEEELPEDWQILPGETDNVAYKSSTDQWIITRPISPGETFSVPYTVRVPLDSTCGTFDVFGLLSESLSRSSYRIEGEGTLELTDKLAVEVVISRWDPEKEKLDLSLNNNITELQAEKAMELWSKNEVVPHTGGKTLGFKKVKEIIAFQLESKPIREL